MESYLKITKDPKAGVLTLEASLHLAETMELACIRHYIVQYITSILSPDAKSITFKLTEKGG